MKKRLFSILLAALMIVSLLPTMAFAKEAGCTHTQKVTTITDGETYQMNLSGKNKGSFTFEASGKNWNIKNSDGKYLNAENGKLVLGSSAKTAWTYSKGAFSISEKTTQKNNGYWWGWMWIPGWGSKTVTTTYYLSTVTNGAKLSTGCVSAELYKTVSGDHDYDKAVYVDKANHKFVCKYCGDVKTEAHSYDGTTHKCVCGAYDPAESSVKISVDVNEKTSKQYVGWWFWGTWKNITTYTATIKTEAKGVKVTKVQYQLNGGRWTTGTCVSSEKPIESLKVKAWDNNGNLYEYEWPEAPVPVFYNVTAQVQGDHGTATVKVGDEEAATASQALEGTTLLFTATPSEGYEFDCWEVVSGGIDIETSKTNNPITVTMPGTALTLKAHFKATVPAEYGIIVEDDGHGTAKAQVGGEDVSSAAPNATVTLVATANDGYAFKEWQIARGLEASDITDNSFTMPSNEVKVKAVFEKEYAIEAEAGGHGTVSADVVKGVSGTEVNLTITPDTGYEVDQISVVRGGVTVESNKFKIGTADVKIRVTFKAIVPSTYGIIVEDDGHGTAKAQVGGEDVSSAAPNATVTLVPTANDGYAFKEWEIARGLDSITDNSFTMPSNEVKVKAIFERVYNITLQTNEHGTASATVGGETVKTAAATAEVTLTATPAEGYQFKEWKVVSGGVTVTDNKFTMPAKNVTIQAVFEAKAPEASCDINPEEYPCVYKVVDIDEFEDYGECVICAVFMYDDGQWILDSEGTPIPKTVFDEMAGSVTKLGDCIHMNDDEASVLCQCPEAHDFDVATFTVVEGDKEAYYYCVPEGAEFSIEDGELAVETYGEDLTIGEAGYTWKLNGNDAPTSGTIENGDAFVATFMTVGDVLATAESFPTNAESGWVNEKGKKVYKEDNVRLMFDRSPLLLGQSVSSVEGGYTCTVGSGIAVGTYTFNMNGNALESIYFEPSAITSIQNPDLGGTYAPAAPTEYTVTFDLNGIEGTAPEAQTITSGEKATKPADPMDTVHTFAGWYKTKNATTGSLSDPWDFDNDTVTADMTLYAQWTRTLESIYTNSDIPKVTENTAPDNAWENGDGGKAFIAYSTSNTILTLYKKLESSGAKQMSCKKTENFTKIGDDYVFSYGTQYGVFTLHMTEGKFTSVTYNGAGTDYEELTGTYSAPAAATYTVTFDMQGHGTQIDPITDVASGSKISAPTAPTAEGYAFKGWYKTKDATTGELSDPWNFESDTVTDNTTLYAKWVEGKKISSILGTVTKFPTSTSNLAPDDAWSNRNDIATKCYKAFGFLIINGGWNIAALSDFAIKQQDGTYVYEGDNGTITFVMNGEKLVSINVDKCKYEDYDGDYVPVKTSTVGDVFKTLGDAAPTENSPWLGGNNNEKKCYQDNGSLMFDNANIGSISADEKLVSFDNTYTYTDHVNYCTIKFTMNDNGILESIQVSGFTNVNKMDWNGIYAPAAPRMSAPLMSMPVVTAVLPEKTQEAETAPELSEIAETVEAEGTETIEVVEQTEETVESAPTSELAWILGSANLNNVHWLGDEDGRECYISDSCLVFTNSSEQDEIALNTLLTQNGSGWMLENGSVTVTFVMEGGMLSQIVYEGDDRFNGEYSAPPEEEDTEENETLKEEPAPKPEPEKTEEEKSEEQPQPVENEETSGQTETVEETEPSAETELNEEKPVEEEPAPEPEPENPEEQPQPVENEEISGQTVPVEETEPAAEE